MVGVSVIAHLVALLRPVHGKSVPLTSPSASLPSAYAKRRVNSLVTSCFLTVMGDGSAKSEATVTHKGWQALLPTMRLGRLQVLVP